MTVCSETLGSGAAGTEGHPGGSAGCESEAEGQELLGGEGHPRGSAGCEPEADLCFLGRSSLQPNTIQIKTKLVFSSLCDFRNVFLLIQR